MWTWWIAGICRSLCSRNIENGTPASSSSPPRAGGGTYIIPQKRSAGKSLMSDLPSSHVIEPPASSPPRAGGGSDFELELCRDFERNDCHRGDSCVFCHTLTEHEKDRQPWNKSQLCGDWLKNECHRGHSCKYRHP